MATRDEGERRAKKNESNRGEGGDRGGVCESLRCGEHAGALGEQAGGLLADWAQFFNLGNRGMVAGEVYIERRYLMGLLG